MQEHYDLLRATSRTFAVGIEALPDPLRDAVTLAYLVLRVSDYFEDSPSLTDESKREALGLWAELLSGTGGEPSERTRTEGISTLLSHVSSEDVNLPDRKAALEAGSILTGVSALPEELSAPIREHTVATTRGMIRWTTRGDDFPDEAALDDYMFEVAGRVGLLLTDLFCGFSSTVNEQRDALLETAVSFGLGLQTVNVIRGLHEDPDRGWTYVPRHVLGDAGEGSIHDLAELSEDTKTRILDFLVAKAGHHLEDALRYCRTIPRWSRGIRTFCLIPALLALRTAEMSRGNPEVFLKPVKVSRFEVGQVVSSTRMRFFSDAWIERAEKRAGALSGRSK